MKRESISVQTKGHEEIKFDYNLPETAQEAIDMFEANNVNEFFKRALIINAQAVARKMMTQGYTTERIQIEMDQWKPGVKMVSGGSARTVDPVKMIAENFGDWTPERQAEIFALIQERFNNRGQSSPVMPTTDSSDGNGDSEPTDEEMAALTAGVNGDTEETTVTPAAEVTPETRRRR